MRLSLRGRLVLKLRCDFNIFVVLAKQGYAIHGRFCSTGLRCFWLESVKAFRPWVNLEFLDCCEVLGMIMEERGWGYKTRLFLAISSNLTIYDVMFL